MASNPGIRPKSLLAETKGLLRRYDLRAKKSLGQHFLVDVSVLKRILEAAQVGKSDTVIEVGPGLGILTRALAEWAGRVIAVELDDKISEILKEDLKPFGNVIVIHTDILEVQPEELLQSAASYVPPSIDANLYKVVANLPYYITSAALRHFLTARLKPGVMVVMVQKEVARQITALPGDMSILSVSVQLYGKPEIAGYVPAGSFYPAPTVDSAILKVSVYPKPIIPVTDEDSFFVLVRAGFCAARKQIGNSLAQGLKVPKAEVTVMLEKAGIAPERRAETLTLEEWGKLWQVYMETRPKC